ncbi:DUF6883 domain-containing protein [Methylobacterium fujisawaense]|uniref:DUF6883 domain-containing protein n=1 Tax=Methylobacterium fujisawaense TaxID=107400 RepID=UPI003CC79F80
MPPYISWPAGFDIAPLKITGYLLNVQGRSPGKARWWLAQGFDLGDPSELIDVLFEHTTAMNFQGISIPRPYWGHVLIFEGPIRTPNGSTPRVRTVWQVDYNTKMGIAGIAKMITAHRI